MDRDRLIDLVNSNGGYKSQELPYNCPFDKLELEGILQYDRPEVFDSQEYTDTVVYNSESNSKLHDRALDFTPMQKDYIDVKKLGLSMSILDKNPNTRRLDIRRKNILEVLNGLPEKLRSLINTIKDELPRLSEYCLGYGKANVQRIMLLYVRHTANIAKIYVAKNELPDYFGIKIKGLDLINNLRESGLLDEQISESVEVHANNILYDFKNKGHLTRRQLMFAQTRVSEFKERYPGVFTARKNLGVVVALMSMRLTRDVKLMHLLKVHADIYGLDKMVRRDNYNAIKRAEDRSEVYMNELNTGISI